MSKTVSSQFTALRMVTLVLGTLLGVSGVNHGVFESMQGWKPTSGFIIQAIGEAQRMWRYGTEEAFTAVPNFLITGVLSVCLGIAVIIWSCCFVHRRHGTLILLLLFVGLFLAGGGIAQVLFVVPVWAYSTRIGRPLQFWRRILSGKGGRLISQIWKYTLALCAVLFLIALEIAVTGFLPGVANQDTRLYVCWGFLAVSWILMNASFISSIADDVAEQSR